ncbi:hypothetical protein [Streptomyces apocyni]|uniref:hypothetical protein n=1 Tax=Streptomyces apocyni TaxID=2654677 RepID=UPI0012EABB48|nr:hypothetical protein [Streptomyces apocyni]
MPAWITPRRLGATATLYAVFVSGWWFGQPVEGDCLAPDGPGGISQRSFDSRDVERLADKYGQVIPEDGATSTAVFSDRAAVCSYKERPRLLAWINGDWG